MGDNVHQWRFLLTRKSPIYNHAAALSDACAQDYDLYVATYVEAAEEACRGRLVNKRGMMVGVCGEDLLRGVGHHMKRSAYASEELQTFMASHPLLTRTQFEEQWLLANVTADSGWAVAS